MSVKIIKEPPFYERTATPTRATGVMSQSGTDAPTVYWKTNEIGEITWTRDSAGQYQGTFDGVENGMTTISLQQSDHGVILAASYIYPALVIKAKDGGGTFIDNCMTGSLIEITHY